MKLLLDTHTFFWWDSSSKQLSAAAIAALRNPTNEVLISVVIVWEMLIKSQLGKLTLRRPLAEIVAEQQANGFVLLSVSLQHVLAIEGLPAIHRDPFDRLLVAQAKTENAIVVTADKVFANYPVQTLW